jgi:hypothetical protein
VRARLTNCPFEAEAVARPSAAAASQQTFAGGTAAAAVMTSSSFAIDERHADAGDTLKRDCPLEAKADAPSGSGGRAGA